MVTTTSAPVAAAAALSTARQPASTARASASADRSKACTSWPAFARLAAMPPPMLPSPMKPITAMARASYFIVGMTKLESETAPPVGQRWVTVLILV